MEIKRFPRWLRTRLTLPEYITLNLLIGFVISLLCLWLLAHLISEVIIVQVDRAEASGVGLEPVDAARADSVIGRYAAGLSRLPKRERGAEAEQTCCGQCRRDSSDCEVRCA